MQLVLLPGLWYVNEFGNSFIRLPTGQLAEVVR